METDKLKDYIDKLFQEISKIREDLAVLKAKPEIKQPCISFCELQKKFEAHIQDHANDRQSIRRAVLQVITGVVTGAILAVLGYLLGANITKKEAHNAYIHLSQPTRQAARVDYDKLTERSNGTTGQKSYR